MEGNRKNCGSQGPGRGRAGIHANEFQNTFCLSVHSNIVKMGTEGISQWNSPYLVCVTL